MTELRPWSGFDTLVDGLVKLQERARDTAMRSVDGILTIRNWLIGMWIIAFEQKGEDRAAYGEGLIEALAKAFKARGVRGLGQRNLRNYRQIAMTWPRLGIRQTVSAESLLPAQRDLRGFGTAESRSQRVQRHSAVRGKPESAGSLRWSNQACARS